MIGPFVAPSPLKGTPLSDRRAGESVEEGSQPQLANAERAPSLVHLLLLISYFSGRLEGRW